MDHEELMHLILDHYEHPRNHGEIENPTVVFEGGNPGCGDIIKLTMNISGDGVIEDLGFKGEGCMVSMAGASMILENLKGKQATEVEEISSDVMRDYLGKRIITTRPQCALAGYNTLKNALIKWRRLGRLDDAQS